MQPKTAAPHSPFRPRSALSRRSQRAGRCPGCGGRGCCCPACRWVGPAHRAAAGRRWRQGGTWHRPPLGGRTKALAGLHKIVDERRRWATKWAGSDGASRRDARRRPRLPWNRQAACDPSACTVRPRHTLHNRLPGLFTNCKTGSSPAASERAAPSAAGRTTAHSTDARDSRAEAARPPQLRAWMPSLGAAGGGGRVPLQAPQAAALNTSATVHAVNTAWRPFLTHRPPPHPAGAAAAQ